VTSETPPRPRAALDTPTAERRAVVSALMDEAHRAASAGRRQLARQRYESALYLLRESAESTSASTILRRVGRSYLDDGDVAAGCDCLTAALAIAEGNGDAGEIAHTVNVMAISEWQRGRLEDAEALYVRAASMAQRAGDRRLVAMVEQNLGVIASMHGDTRKALSHFMRSYADYRELGMADELALLLNNIGIAQVSLEEWDEAERTYSEAMTLAASCGANATRLMIEVNRIALLIGRRDFEGARSACDSVLREATTLHETRLLAETHRHCGVIARETGRAAEAEEYFRMAFDQAMLREDLLLAAETAREQAELYLVLGRNRDTLQALSLSHRLFSRLQAQRDLSDVRQRLRRLEHRFHYLVRQYAQDIESKDAYTLGHCERVADIACAIATDFGLDETTLFWFRVGALLHDVGKVVVSVDILNKAGPLTPEERAIMERHPVAGVELLRDVDFPWDVIPMIRGHHERWDGHGYPDALAGDAIPLAARILCVADVYDALTSDRPYRRAFEPREALRLMQADVGRQFDPEILARFFRLMAQSRLPATPAIVPPSALFSNERELRRPEYQQYQPN
jgi:putative nucleotidyltransferase with HDIG domain